MAVKISVTAGGFSLNDVFNSEWEFGLKQKDSSHFILHNNFGFGDIGKNTIFSISGNNFTYNNNSFVSGTITSISYMTESKSVSWIFDGLKLKAVDLDTAVYNDAEEINSSGDNILPLLNLRSLFSSFQVDFNGGAGNDTYYAGKFDDNLRGNSGKDLLIGGAGKDKISGGTGNDTINGGSGKDILSGGTGVDTFIYTSKTDGGDVITDFDSSDFISFKSAAFGKITKGTLASDFFVSRKSDHVAQDTNDHFIFQKSDDTLWFDSDGKGGTAAVLIADFSKDFDLKSVDILIA